MSKWSCSLPNAPVFFVGGGVIETYKRMLYCLKPYDAQNVLITGLFHPSRYPSPTDAPLVLALKGKEAEKHAASTQPDCVYTMAFQHF